MPKIAGGLLRPKIVTEASAPSGMQVSWKWYNENQGLVEWTLTNPNDAVGTVILFRNGYIFGDAYFPVYEANPAFGVNWAQNLDALPDNGAGNNAPPIGIVQWPDGKRIVAFLFSVAGKSSWSMLEGGFSSVMPPSGISLYDVTFNASGQYCCKYDPAQVTDWDLQTGTGYQGWSPNPSTFTTIVVNAPADAPYVLLFSGDSETDGACSSSGGGGQSCQQMIEQGIATNNIQEVIQGINCLIDSGFVSVGDVVRSVAKHEIEKKGETIDQYIDKVTGDVRDIVRSFFGAQTQP